MFNFIDNLYYRFYRFITSLGEEAVPRYNAVLLLSILTMFNFITVVVLLMVVTNKIIIVNLPGVYLLGIGLFVIAINSYIVFANKRYLDIEERFSNESKSARVRNNLKTIVYVVLTILFLILSLIYLNDHPIIRRNN